MKTRVKHFLSTCPLAMILALLVMSAITWPATAQSNSDAGDQQNEQNDQNEQNGEQDPDDTLPEHALWRHGESGKLSQLNGYYRIKFSPDGKLMAARNQMNVLSLIDVETQKTLFEFQSYEDRQWIQNIDFSPDSKFLVASTQGVDENISIWNAKTGKLHREIESEGKVALFRNADEVLILHDQELVGFSIETGNQVSRLSWGREGDLPLACSRDGAYVAFARKLGRQNKFALYVSDLNNKTNTVIATQVAMPRRMVVSEDGNWLAGTFTRGEVVSLWDLREPSKPPRLLRAHDGTAEAACFSPDSRYLASTGWDAQVYLWDVLTGDRIDKLSGHSGHVTACGFSPIGLTLATGANGREDCSILVWDFQPLVFPKTDGKPEIEFETLWQMLSQDKPQEPLKAVSMLVNNPDMFQQQVSDKLGLQSTQDSTEKIEQWILDLSDRRYATRLAAEEQLKACRLRAEPLLQAMLNRTDLVLEVRFRISRIMRQPVERPKIAKEDLRRLHRIIYAMELNGGEWARGILLNLAETHDHVDIAKDAQASWKRAESNAQSEQD